MRHTIYPNVPKRFAIYYGAPAPMIAIGTRQVALLMFAEKYPGWHTIGRDPSDIRAMRRLAEKGYLQTVADQFRSTYPTEAK